MRYLGHRWAAAVEARILTVRDGAISIARAFTRRDWEALLQRAGLHAQIAWHVAFRFSVSRLK